MPKIIIAGNWKMNKTIKDALELVNGLKRNLIDIEKVEILVCPPYICLDQVSDTLKGSTIKFGAQNMHFEKSGAFTGEVAAEMLTEIGCSYVILGHSERRHIFGEKNELINKKVTAALGNGLTPILCVGETIDERKANKTFDVVSDHLEGGLTGVDTADYKRMVIAYEPVWAIGTGLTATPEQAQEVHAFIRKKLAEKSNAETAASMTIQYGGSVKPDNIAELIKQTDIDGALVGGASLKVDSFTAIVTNAVQALEGK